VSCVCAERRGRGGKPSEGDVRHNLIYTADSNQPDVEMTSHPRHDRRHHDDRPPAGSSRPVPKPRSASTSSTLDPTADPVRSSLDRSLDESAEPVRPRPRARGSQESLDRSFDQPPPQHRARTRGSQDSLDKSFDKPVAKERPTPATRRSQEALDTAGVDRPKPRARQGSLDRSLDESFDQPTRGPQGPQKPSTRGPQVAVKQSAGKKPGRDRPAVRSSDGTDV